LENKKTISKREKKIKRQATNNVSSTVEKAKELNCAMIKKAKKIIVSYLKTKDK
jgi:hypothetical protein